MIQIHLHSLGTFQPETHWTNAALNKVQVERFGENALGKLLADYWTPVRPDWSDGLCTEIRFID